jgi:hypothetical protein
MAGDLPISAEVYNRSAAIVAAAATTDQTAYQDNA